MGRENPSFIRTLAHLGIPQVPFFLKKVTYSLGHSWNVWGAMNYVFGVSCTLLFSLDPSERNHNSNLVKMFKLLAARMTDRVSFLLRSPGSRLNKVTGRF